MLVMWIPAFATRHSLATRQSPRHACERRTRAELFSATWALPLILWLQYEQAT